MEQFIFSKSLPETAIAKRLCIPIDKLNQFPPFVGGNRIQNLIVEDMEEQGVLWNLRFYVQDNGKQPVLAGQWKDFVKRKQLQVGDGVLFYRNIDANGQVTYKMRPFRNLMGV
ncbi:hypothetical protein Pint_09611 [Pistacia integerrima]|uniref:Uncharacterized protein n=1 Tax=Pistacia integerrima TaxID=434235 RepID=A0ACC0XGS1_9ROSI|nr:hypothetical protein Pint_09611 [Pistacia integerrima]